MHICIIKTYSYIFIYIYNYIWKNRYIYVDIIIHVIYLYNLYVQRHITISLQPRWRPHENGSTPACKEYMRELHHLGSVPIVIQQMNQFPQDVSCQQLQHLSSPTIFGASIFGECENRMAYWSLCNQIYIYIYLYTSYNMRMHGVSPVSRPPFFFQLTPHYLYVARPFLNGHGSKNSRPSKTRYSSNIRSWSNILHLNFTPKKWPAPPFSHHQKWHQRCFPPKAWWPQVQLQQYGCQYLCSMAQAMPDVREEILQHGGIRPLIAAMNNFPQERWRRLKKTGSRNHGGCGIWDAMIIYDIKDGNMYVHIFCII